MPAVPKKSGYSHYKGSIGGRSPSLKWPHLYDLLRAKGYDKEKSARISNSRIHMRKNGKIKGLPYRSADNPKALDRVLKKYNKKRSTPKQMAAALIAACNSEACLPPPLGTGGTLPSGTIKSAAGTGKSTFVSGPRSAKERYKNRPFGGKTVLDRALDALADVEVGDEYDVMPDKKARETVSKAAAKQWKPGMSADDVIKSVLGPKPSLRDREARRQYADVADIVAETVFHEMKVHERGWR